MLLSLTLPIGGKSELNLHLCLGEADFLMNEKERAISNETQGLNSTVSLLFC